MGLADIIRGGIATARDVTLPLHVDVTHSAWTGQTAAGDPTYVVTVRKALAERKQKLVRAINGTQEMSAHYVAFLEQIAATTAQAGFARTNPIDVNDIITLPDGTTGPILAVDGFFDGGTGVPFYSQVWMG